MSRAAEPSATPGMEPVRRWQAAAGGLACLAYCLAPWLQRHGIPVGLLPWLAALVVILPSLRGVVASARRRGWRLLVTALVAAVVVEAAGNVVGPLVRALLVPGLVDRNPSDVLAMFGGNVPLLLVMVVVVGPIIEEVLYRFSVFNPLSQVAPALAYLVVGLLFGLQHVLPSLVETGDLRYLVNAIGYGVAGLALCWAYRREGSLAAPLLAHMLANATVVFML